VKWKSKQQLKSTFFSFKQWVEYEIAHLDDNQRNQLGYHWLRAVVESFAQKRLDNAPIDEPCDAWVTDLISILE